MATDLEAWTISVLAGWGTMILITLLSNANRYLRTGEWDMPIEEE